MACAKVYNTTSHIWLHSTLPTRNYYTLICKADMNRLQITSNNLRKYIHQKIIPHLYYILYTRKERDCISRKRIRERIVKRDNRKLYFLLCKFWFCYSNFILIAFESCYLHLDEKELCFHVPTQSALVSTDRKFTNVYRVTTHHYAMCQYLPLFASA